jgi:glycosyltransferase involved in cell wall biosynthesis
MKKIILLAHEDLYGGGTQQTFFLAREMVRTGIETVLVSNAETTWLGTTIAESGLPIKTYYSQAIQRSIQPLKEIQVLCYLLGVFLREKPDVVLASGVKLIGLGGVAGWLCRVPRRVAIIRGEGAPPGSLLLKVIYRMERLMAILGTEYITVSEYIRQQMLLHGICSEAQITSIHDGIDVGKFWGKFELSNSRSTLFNSRYALPENAFKIGMVGRLVRGKRYDQFIVMMKRLCEEFSHVYGILIGEGEHRAQLQAEIEASGFSERILIAGYCSDMPSVYRDLDLTALFTDYEGCPNAVLESMAAKIPVIASDVCGIQEIIHSGENGYLIASGNIETAIAHARLLLKNDTIRKSLGHKAHQTITENFNLELQVQKVIQTLLQV